jgi:hypothetical protein
MEKGKTMLKMYRKKPVVVEAVQWKSDNFREIEEFMKDSDRDLRMHGATIFIRTLEGTHAALPGDFIIKGVHGEFYPCKPDIFEETYEEVTDAENH